MMTSPLSVPPRFVPTLTTVVELAPAPVEVETSEMVDPSASGHTIVPTDLLLSEDEAFGLEDQLVHRVLQRIDLSLEERFRETVREALQQQLDAMLPRLRAEIETLLRKSAVEALAQEFSENTGSMPSSEPQSLG